MRHWSLRIGRRDSADPDSNLDADHDTYNDPYDDANPGPYKDSDADTDPNSPWCKWSRG
jgi:hypothetical protein